MVKTLTQALDKLLSGLGINDICSPMFNQKMAGVICTDGSTSDSIKRIYLFDTDGDEHFDMLSLEVISKKSMLHDVRYVAIDRRGGITVERCEEDPEQKTSGCNLVLDLNVGLEALKSLVDNVSQYFNIEVLAKIVKEQGLSNAIKTISSDLIKTVTGTVAEALMMSLIEPLLHTWREVSVDNKLNKNQKSRRLRIFG